MALASSALANAQAIGNATATRTTNSSINGVPLCDRSAITRLAANVSCEPAPLYTPINDTSARAACSDPKCEYLAMKLSELEPVECWLSNSTLLRRNYLDPLASYCGFIYNTSGSTNDSSSGNDRPSATGGLNTSASSSPGTNGSRKGNVPTDLLGPSTLTPAPRDNNNNNDSLNSLSTLAIILLVVGSVSGGGLVTVLVVWLRSQRRKRRAQATGASDSSPRKLAQELLTPSTQDGSGALEASANNDTGDHDTEAPAPLPDMAIGLTTAMQMHWTGGDVLTTVSSSGGFWDDDAVVAARIPKDKITVDKLLSRGGFGEVYRGTYNNQCVAIKTLLPEKRKHLRQINAFLAEVKLMAFLEHERIVTFIGVAWDSLSDVCVLTEYMEGGDLRALLDTFEHSDNARPMGLDRDKLTIALHIAHALTYLHSLQPIVLHRDLKSKNILLDSQLNAKLTDFGVSRERGDSTMTAGVGTSLWMAPEVMLGERYDQRADMFSFGIVLSELDSHALPYAAAHQAKAIETATSMDAGRRLPVLQLVSLGRLSVQFSDAVTPELRTLGMTCVSLDPYERPTAAEAMCTLHRALKTLRVS